MLLIKILDNILKVGGATLEGTIPRVTQLEAISRECQIPGWMQQEMGSERRAVAKGIVWWTLWADSQQALSLSDRS